MNLMCHVRDFLTLNQVLQSICVILVFIEVLERFYGSKIENHLHCLSALVLFVAEVSHQIFLKNLINIKSFLNSCFQFFWCNMIDCMHNVAAFYNSILSSLALWLCLFTCTTSITRFKNNYIITLLIKTLV